MRVCFVSQAAYGLFDPQCAAPFGGAELQMYLLAKELSKTADFDVHFLVQDYGQPKRQRFDDITVWRYSRPLRTASWAAPIRWAVSAVSTYTTLNAIGADVVIESPAGFPTAIAAAWRGASKRRTFVYWVASDADLEGGISGFSLERNLALWGMLRADVLIAQNQYQRSGLLERFKKTALLLRNAFPIPPAPPSEKDGSVLWVASSQDIKRPDVFLDLAEARPDVRFVMVMPMSNAAVFDRVSVRAQQMSNVDFSPGLPLEAVQVLFDRASAFVNTSSVEGFPNTFVQAAIAATPVLSLAVDPDGVLEGAGFGRLAHGDTGVLGRLLDEVLADSELRSAMGNAGFRYAEREHDIRKVIEQLRETLACVDRRGRSGHERRR